MREYQIRAAGDDMNEAMIYSDRKGKDRCRRCEKLVFDSKWTAEDVVSGARDRGTNLRAYFDGECGFWHLTSQAERSREWVYQPVIQNTPQPVSASSVGAGWGFGSGRGSDENEAGLGFFVLILVVPLLPFLLAAILFDRMRLSQIRSYILAAAVEIALIEVICAVFFDTTPVLYLLSGVVSVFTGFLDQIYIHFYYLLVGEMPW